jgi:FtsP/CotA-like multicopper oxidase with cupredoxin domain
MWNILLSRSKWPLLGMIALVLLVAASSTVAALSGYGFAAPTCPDPPSPLAWEERPAVTIRLRATTGRILTPDGNSLFMWGFAEEGGAFQYPSPTLIVQEGDAVTVHLVNELPEPVSIVFPGQGGVLANGQPVQPQLDAQGNLISLVDDAPPGGEITYTFVAEKPGTYLYESGTQPAKQIQMGLFGALIVRPAIGANYAYNNMRTVFHPEREYLLLLHELDPLIHEAVEQGREPDLAAFRPRYWTINGRCFPDTEAPAGAPWLPAQPYRATVITEPYDETTNPLPALIRLVNAGAHTYPFHTHGFHLRLIGQNGRPLADSACEWHPLIVEKLPARDLSRSEFTITVGAGQTYEGLFIWTDVNGWKPGITPSPAQASDQPALSLADSENGGSAYLDYQEYLPEGMGMTNECGEYYFPWHTYSEQRMVNWGGKAGGMMTMLRVNPPGGCR